MQRLNRGLVAIGILLGATTTVQAGSEQLSLVCEGKALQSVGHSSAAGMAGFLEERASPVDETSDRYRVAFREADPPEVLYRATMLCSRHALSGDGTPVISVSLTGKIDESLLAPMGAVFTGLLDSQQRLERKFDEVTLTLHSRGGDMNVAEALGSGMFDMDLQLTTNVGDGDLCISACVLLLAAGDNRKIEGKVGIHRMYFREGTAHKHDDETYARALDNLRAYFEKVGIDPAIVDAMLDVGPDEAHFLSDRELTRYGFADTGR